jgi:NADPH-dependent curcumin reductase CurA
LEGVCNDARERPTDASASAALGILGLTGLTAYFGLLDLGKPRKGEVVVVSAAAGATGSTVAQIAKNVVGCYTIGVAGGAEKCRYLSDELELDAVVEYVGPRSKYLEMSSMNSHCPWTSFRF